MPPVAAAAAVIASQISAATIASFALKVALSVGLSLLQQALIGKPKGPRQSQERRFTVRSAQAPRQTVYGQTRVKDPVLIHAEETENNKFLHLFLAFAGHECEAVDAIYFDNERIGALDADGNVTTGTFRNFARVRVYLGTDDQAADPDAIAELADWSASDRGLGVCYVYLRLRHSLTVYPNGIPNVTADIRGKRVKHYSDGVTRWTNNAPLCGYDYLLDATRGFAAEPELVAAESATDEAVADEFVGVAEQSIAASAATSGLVTLEEAGFRMGDRVTVADGPPELTAGQNYYWARRTATTGLLAASIADARAGVGIAFAAAAEGLTITRKGQLRYAVDGSFLADQNRLALLDELVGAMAGRPMLRASGYRLQAGADQAAVGHLTASDFSGGFRVTAFRPFRDLYNIVQGTFPDANDNYVETDFTAQTSAAFQAQDGQALERDLELNFTTDAQAAQRLALIDLAQSRQALTLEVRGALNLIQYEQGDVVTVTLASEGFDAKKFRVVRDGFAPDFPAYELTLVEYADGLYDVDAESLAAIDPAPNTGLVAQGFVDPPAGVSTAINTVNTGDGDRVSEILVTGDASPDDRVTLYRAELKLASAQSYDGARVVQGPAFPLVFAPVDATSIFDVRLAAITFAGAQSDFVEATDIDADGADTVAPSAPTGLANTGEVVSVGSLSRTPLEDETISFTGGGGSGAAAIGVGQYADGQEGDIIFNGVIVEVTAGGRGYATAPDAVGDETGFTYGTTTIGNPTHAHLTWTDPADSDLARIDVYRGPDSDSANAIKVGSADAGDEISSPPFSVSAGNSEFFFLRAIDEAGNPSGFTTGLSVSRTS